MAVKVVSEAPLKTRQVTCCKCCYRLEYTGIDVKSDWRSDGEGGRDEHFWIDCPKCKETVAVPRWSMRD